MAELNTASAFSWNGKIHLCSPSRTDGQWRWDFAVASHGAAFHAPQEITRILSNGLYYAQQARLENAKVLAKHGFNGEVPMPDITTKAKAQKYIGLDMADKEAKKAEFMKNIQPQWVKDAMSKGKMKSL